jgi:lysophospholipase L1-like esterase
MVVLLVLTTSAAVSRQMPECAAPPEIIRLKVDLPYTIRALRSGQPLVIVAIGSSSTKGIGASDSAHAYPALLAEELHRGLPQLPLNVINQGVGGERAFQMLARFERDVLPYHPQLVIWQTGSNQTLTSDDTNAYTATIHEGVSRLKSARADVILMIRSSRRALSPALPTCSLSIPSTRWPKICTWGFSGASRLCGTGSRPADIK